MSFWQVLALIGVGLLWWIGSTLSYIGARLRAIDMAASGMDSRMVQIQDYLYEYTGQRQRDETEEERFLSDDRREPEAGGAVTRGARTGSGSPGRRCG